MKFFSDARWRWIDAAHVFLLVLTACLFRQTMSGSVLLNFPWSYWVHKSELALGATQLFILLFHPRLRGADLLRKKPAYALAFLALLAGSVAVGVSIWIMRHPWNWEAWIARGQIDRHLWRDVRSVALISPVAGVALLIAQARLRANAEKSSLARTLRRDAVSGFCALAGLLVGAGLLRRRRA